MTRITKPEWSAIFQAVDMIACGEWDDGSYGERPDFETILDKIAERLPKRRQRP